MDLKKLRILTGSCKRLHKELLSYLNEEKDEREKMIKMKNNPNTEPYALKQQEEVLKETLSVIPDIRTRLESLYYDLCSGMQMAENENEQVLNEEIFKEALVIKETLESFLGNQ
eukprot:TRINITY_DN10371_c0_g1_i1.p1 TRINITY_DN10371_c0_g1~~TRINITY_DN10371_c0_g1_i1.p1  ORF type:complete len:114 (-),score=19.00 TRINITY_DN10371_c0_g1_i1:50-391(-)